MLARQPLSWWMDFLMMKEEIVVNEVKASSYYLCPPAMTCYAGDH